MNFDRMKEKSGTGMELGLERYCKALISLYKAYSCLRNPRREEVFFPKMGIFDGRLAGWLAGIVFGSYLSQFSPYSHKIMSNRIVVKLCIERCGF